MIYLFILEIQVKIITVCTEQVFKVVRNMNVTEMILKYHKG